MIETPPTLSSCFYFGRVMHARLHPFRHRFTYRVFAMLIDLDDVAHLPRRCKLFAYNRWNALSFHDRDHGPRDGSPLRPWINRILLLADIDIAGGPVRILCLPRVFGYVFNPLSIWFCHHRDGALRAVLYEVSNTFGERHSYLIPVDRGRGAGETIHQRCDKGFHVSPFMGMDATYHFRLRPPSDRLSVRIEQTMADGRVLVAVQTGARRPFSEGTIFAALTSYPLMTFKVIAAIHWQALHLWRKGARFHRKPPPPSAPVTPVEPGLSKVAE
jgi:DUF1365 family protein